MTLRTLQSVGAATGPLSEKIQELGPWFHNLHLPDGSQTAPDHPLGDYPRFKWEALASHLPEDMRGLQVLDIGCNAGYYSFELARRGAHVVAMDHDPHYLLQAKWAAEQLGLSDSMTFRQGDVYELAGRSERYDVVLFLGIFYHLRYPLLGLDLAASASRDVLLFQSLSTSEPALTQATDDPGYLGLELLRQDGWPKLAFIEHELAGDSTNWWVPNPPAMDAMVRSAGYQVAARVAGDIHLCRRTAAADSADRRLVDLLAKLG